MQVSTAVMSREDDGFSSQEVDYRWDEEKSELELVFSVACQRGLAFEVCKDIGAFLTRFHPEMQVKRLSGTTGEVGFMVQGFSQQSMVVGNGSNTTGGGSTTTLRFWEKLEFRLIDFEAERKVSFEGSHTKGNSDVFSSAYHHKFIRTFTLEDTTSGRCKVIVTQKDIEKPPEDFCIEKICICCPNAASVREDKARKLAKNYQSLFNTYAPSYDLEDLNLMTQRAKNLLKEATPSAEFQRGPAPTVFLSHNWGTDSKSRNNHDRVARFAKSLSKLGVTVWLDEEEMNGNIYSSMAQGIDNAKVVVIFVTRKYMDKVNGEDPMDNCRLEFDYACAQKPESILLVIMEPEMSQPSAWTGRFKLMIGNRLFLDANLDNDPEAKAQDLRDMITKLS